MLLTGVVAFLLTWTIPVQASARQSATAAATLVFDHVTVVDVEQGKLVPDQRVIITGNRIEVMGKASAVKIPKEAQIVAARGKYLIPGLWDLHTHSMRRSHIFYPALIANGVTGIRDAWSPMPAETVSQWHQEILAGTRVGPPRQLLSGRMFDLAGNIGQGGTATEDTPERRDTTGRLIDSLRAAGATMVKAYPLSFIVAGAARQRGVRLGGHLPKSISAIQASDSGVGIIDHATTSGGLDQVCLGQSASLAECRTIAARLRQNNTWLVPTLAILSKHRTGISTTQQIATRLHQFAPAFWDSDTLLRRNLAAEGERPSQDSLGYLHIAQRAGLPILAGTDIYPNNAREMPPGFALHAELEIYVAEGLTPLEALQTATLNPAKFLQATDSLGTVAPGKLADLVLLDADPLADITNTTAIHGVVANGRYFDRATLDGLLTEVKAQAKPKVRAKRPAP